MPEDGQAEFNDAMPHVVTGPVSWVKVLRFVLERRLSLLDGLRTALDDWLGEPAARMTRQQCAMCRGTQDEAHEEKVSDARTEVRASRATSAAA
jgi:hypothetical protein